MTVRVLVWDEGSEEMNRGLQRGVGEPLKRTEGKQLLRGSALEQRPTEGRAAHYVKSWGNSPGRGNRECKALHWELAGHVQGDGRHPWHRTGQSFVTEVGRAWWPRDWLGGAVEASR